MFTDADLEFVKITDDDIITASGSCPGGDTQSGDNCPSGNTSAGAP